MQKRADVERAVTSRFVSHISSHVSVASRTLAQLGITAALKSIQLFRATKYKRKTTHERLYRISARHNVAHGECASGGCPTITRPSTCPKS
jgi:hypothetical protein